MSLRSINPATDEIVAEYAVHTPGEGASIVDAAQDAFLSWSNSPIAERAERLTRMGELLRKRAEDYARLVTTEMGKPVESAKAEANKCATVCDHYAEHAETYLAPEQVETNARKSYVAYRPLGAMLAIMPWNFPFWQVMRCAVPAIAAGNTVVLKHASNVTGCALAIEQLFADSEFPVNAFRALRIEVDGVESIIRHRKIVSVSLTGSTRAGKSVARIAGDALKRCILELGGSDPFIVLDDAEMDSTLDAAQTGRLQANGQSCIAAKRFIVVESRLDEFTKGLVERFRAVKMGDPMDPANELGPLARMDLRETLHRQVQDSVIAGANLLCGGQIPPGMGAYYPATVLGNVRPGMPAGEEEIFGPVAAIIAAKDEDDAIRIANDTEYGLGAVVCSADRERAERIARDRLEAGSCFVNAFTRSDPRLPFGGIKGSGIGRELGAHGIRELCNVKTVYIE
jgi:succinate-semialdehyde dehydrogenase/glutarate-semialdehyde dehydrogenase